MATGAFNPNQSGTPLRSWEKSNSNADIDSLTLEPGKPDTSLPKDIGNFGLWFGPINHPSIQERIRAVSSYMEQNGSSMLKIAIKVPIKLNISTVPRFLKNDFLFML